LHSFASSDGSPFAGWHQSRAPTETSRYDLNDGANGSGTVFKITGAARSLSCTALRARRLRAEILTPPLVQASNGKFYGNNLGRWKLRSRNDLTKFNSSGSFSTVYIFCLANPNTCTDGYNPEGALVEAAPTETCYGMTARGGDPACGLNGIYRGCGTIFKITPGGTLTTIHDFEGTDGAGPVSSLIQGHGCEISLMAPRSGNGAT